MEDKEFYIKLDEVMEELLPGVKHLAIQDYGKLNEVLMEITRRRNLSNLEMKINVQVK